MEKQNQSRKNGSTKWIAAWITIFFSFSQIFSANGETTMYSSGMDETTIYQDPSTSTYISVTPFLSTAPTTLAIYTTTDIQQCNKDKEFITYGLLYDTRFPKGDDNYIVKCPEIDVPINKQNLGCFFISTNGYITNGLLLPYTPDRSFIDTTKITLMPLWTDIDTRFDGGDLFYQVYNVYDEAPPYQQKNILTEIKALFSELTKTSTFTPKWALKLTWSDVLPFDATGERLTFQFILATDGTRTYMAYLYENCDFSWDTTRNAIMGYVYPNEAYYHLNYSTPGIFDLRHQTNTYSKNGVFLFEMSTDYTKNYPQLCLEWKISNTPIDTNSAGYLVNMLLAPCPCTLWQARRDTRYRRGPNRCYYLTFPQGTYSKVCCYTKRALIRGNVQLTSAILDEQTWFETDYTPYYDCCLQSDYCDIYNEYRPPDDCRNFFALFRLFGFGDPHIQTLDGYDYTFNGLGEFDYLNVYNKTVLSNVLMQIQCRTKKVGTNGESATAFSAFVIQSEGVSIQFGIFPAKNQIKIFGNGKELTSFYSDKEYTWNVAPFFVSANDKDGYIVQHKSQTVIEVDIKNRILQLSIVIGYNKSDVKTDGLLGTYNGNKTDDLQTPKGVIIPIDSTEKYIYNNFGMLWKVNNSIFHYENSETQASYQFPSFEPSFVVFNKSSLIYQKAVDICTEKDKSCVYDYIVTQDESLANNTKEVEVQIAFNNLLANLTSPTFAGASTIVVYINKQDTFTVNINSTSSNLTLTIAEEQHCKITLSDKTVVVTIDIKDVVPVKAAFQVSDEYQMSTPILNLTVMVCPNCINGKCDTAAVNGSLKYAYICECDKGWRGALCDIDARCDPLGCPCNGSGSNITCDCPSGYKFAEKCVDIDECNGTNTCEQLCENTLGSYKCMCKSGYRLFNSTHCEDIDECKESLNTCVQKCKNTIGSYECECYDGYKLNGSRCEQEIDFCANTTECTNATGCTNSTGGTVQCFCSLGYTWNSTLKQCEDVNECDSVSCINGTCVNTKGSYFCKCDNGTKLDSDMRTCAECPHSKWGENCANTCTGAKCIACNKTTGCICAPGFEGPTCANDIDECKDPNICNTSISECENGVGSYACKCKPGFLLSSDTNKCLDINECAGTKNCSKNADCTNTIGSYTCKCKSGYTGDGITCTDIDECETTHPCSHDCVNQIGSYSCVCRGSAILQDDRKTCVEEGGLTYQERLYIIIFSSLGGALVVGLIATLWFYCYGCCACCTCFGCCRRIRHRRLRDWERDLLNIRPAFGSQTSSLRGQLGQDGPFSGATTEAKYLDDWEFFSPYSENRLGARDNGGWEDSGESASSWGNIIHHFDNSREFRIERPKLKH